MKGCYQLHRFLDKVPKRVAMTIFIALFFGHAQIYKNVLSTSMKILSEKQFLKKEQRLFDFRNNSNNSRMICSRLEREKSPPPYQDIRGFDPGWTPHQNTVMKAMYGLTYSVLAIPCGILADRYGGKNFLTVGILAGSVSIFVAPFLFDATGGDLWTMKIIRVIVGTATALIMTGGYAVMSHWAPPNERARLCGTALGGTHLGSVTHLLTTARMIRKTRNYAMPYYVFSGTGLLLAVLWHLIGASNPYQKKNITSNEKLYLDTEMGNSIDHRRKKRVVFFRMFTSLDVISGLVAIAMYVWSWNISLYNMDVYLLNVLNRSSIADKYGLSLLFFLLVVTGVACCFFSDWAIHTNTVSRTTIRKYFTNTALMGQAIFLLAGAYTHCSLKVTSALFIVSGLLAGCIIPGALIVPFDLAPNYAATIMAVGTSVGTVCILAIDPMVKRTIPDRTLGQYRTLFWIVLATSAVCNYFFVLFGNANEKGWNRIGNRLERRRQ